MPWILKETEIRYRRTAKLQRDRHVDSSRVVNDVMHEADDKIGCATGVEERFIVLAVDAKNRILGWHLAGKGDVSNCPASPGAIFRAALAVGASGIVLVHNHPSGEPEPSRDDVALTEKVRRGGDLLGIRVLDHVIVTADPCRYFSFLDSGLFSKRGVE